MRALIIKALILAVSVSALGQPVRQNSGDTSKAVAQVMKLESRWVRAVMRRDAKALGRILADDYEGTSSDGEIRNKEQTLNELKSASVGFKSLEPYGFDVRVGGDTATVTGRIVVKVVVEDQLVTSRFSYTRDYVKRKGRWQVVSSRTTRIGE
jgi:ketosteroid isomerase-like protein